MTEIEKIKEIIKKDENFNKSFLGVKNVKTALAIAKSKGFNNVSAEDILNDNELEDALLCAAAGGKKDTTIYNNQHYEYHYDTIVTDQHTEITGNGNPVTSQAKIG